MRDASGKFGGDKTVWRSRFCKRDGTAITELVRAHRSNIQGFKIIIYRKLAMIGGGGEEGKLAERLEGSELIYIHSRVKIFIENTDTHFSH